MKFSAWLVLVYALIILFGGIMGFKQAHSVPSLIVGVTSAVLLCLCAFGMFKRSTLAYTLSLVLMTGLTFFFAYRFLITFKIMPAGMMMLISAFCLTFVLSRRKRKARLI
jgi:uncharacterized membrane protein (UPF0136 family)